jgi:O-Antigen ligase
VSTVSTSVAALRPGRGVPLPVAEARDRSVRRRVGIVWGLLVLNVMGYTGALVHIPGAIGKGLTQGALPVALLVALTINRKIVIRPNVFLCLAFLLATEAIVTALQPHSFGTVYRTFRMVEFVAALWLLTPWWGRRDLLLVRCHLKALAVVLGSVLLGVLIAPNKAIGTGRLIGVLWAVPATQVAHYSAVIFGVTAVLWFCGQLRSRVTVIIVSAAGVILILTHTRTALVAMVAGLLVAGLSLIAAKARVRKLFAVAGAVTAVAIMTLSGVLASWLSRGQGSSQLTHLTGRTAVWGPLLAFPRDKFQEIFGFGLSNDSFNGLPIDSNWLASYQSQGLLGVVICATMLIFLLALAYFQPRGVQRALALFLVTYCLIASFTEVGFTGPSPYLLELTLAASLLVPPAATRNRG